MKPFEVSILTPIEEGLLEAILVAKEQRKAVVAWIETNQQLPCLKTYRHVENIYHQLTKVINGLDSSMNEIKLVARIIGRMD